MDIWSWICELPNSDDLNHPPNSQLTFQLAKTNDSTRSIYLQANPTLDPDNETSITFSICLDEKPQPVWVSDPCPLSSDKPFLPLVLQLLHEIVSRSPTATGTPTCRRLQLSRLKPEPISWILDSHSAESFSTFFTLVFFTRLFWLCASDSPLEVGSLYFHSILTPNLDIFSCPHSPVLRNFFLAVGTDVELCLVRSFGYVLAKWLILREVEVGLKSLTPLAMENLGFSYAVETHGLWVLKGYSPVRSMKSVDRYYSKKGQLPSVIDAKESLLRYALAHQQLEAVIQFEYNVRFLDNYIHISARVDNIRIHVARLGFKRDDDSGEGFLGEKHFPSRVRVWVGPEVGAGYVGGLSMGGPTDKVERETELQRTLEGVSGNSKVPEVRATARMSTKTKMRNWRWDHDVEGNTVVFEAVLCDDATGAEVAMWRPPAGGGIDFWRGVVGSGRPLTKSGGLIFSGEESGAVAGWRLSKEMEGSVLKWRIGGKVWLSYWANDGSASACETRFVEWCDEVDLPLIPIQS